MVKVQVTKSVECDKCHYTIQHDITNRIKLHNGTVLDFCNSCKEDMESRLSFANDAIGANIYYKWYTIETNELIEDGNTR